MSSTSAEQEKTVLYSEEGRVGLIRFNRPAQMNASSRQFRADLADAMDQADRNTDIRVVVVTGEGRGFSAGADLTESFVEYRGTISEHILKDYKTAIDAVAQSDKAYIAAIHGPAAGVMLAFAMACDLVIMAEDSYLYSPFAALSLVPDGGATWFLLNSFGYQKAFEIIVERKKMTAAECLQAGFANQLVPADQLREVAMSRATVIADQTAPLSLKYAKQLLRTAQSASREDVTRAEAILQHVCSQSADFAEGVAAFMQKRPPEFKGE